MSSPVIEYEMGYQPDEFGRVLCGPFSGENSVYRCESIETNHWRINHQSETFLLEIKTAEMPPRKLGPIIEMPVLKVQFHMENTDDLQQAQFFARFHQYFHKGGG